MNNPLEHLQARNIKPTAIRLLILKAMLTHPQALSLLDLENTLDTVDRSTIFRTLTLFHHHHLIHRIDDGSGSVKYSVCNTHCTCSLSDLHAHFTCTRCAKTICLEHIPIPKVQLPPGFVLESVNYVLKGHCRQCTTP